MNSKYFDAPIKALLVCLGSLLALTVASGFILISSRVSASIDAVDNVAITIPTACSMGGVIDTAHSATLQGGTYSAATGSEYANGIGKTTLTTFCNDYNGFSIYAIGSTNNQDGNNTLVGTNTPSNTIATKVYESSDTASNWSMKVNKVNDSSISYNPINMNITNSFDNWHSIPDTYTKVAQYKAQTGPSTTDASGSLGAKVETTYAAYISTTQPADTYTGQVKYVVVHPYNYTAPTIRKTIDVVYDGNGLTFPGGATTNTVTYVANPMYIANTPQIVKSPNIDSQGNQDGPYYTAEDEQPVEFAQPFTFQGASKIKVVLHYGITAQSAGIGIWGTNFDAYYYSSDQNLSGVDTLILDGDSVTIDFYASDIPATDYDYGMYAEIYPIFDTSQTDTSPSAEYYSRFTAENGTYAAPGGLTHWSSNGGVFLDEADVVDYISNNAESLSRTGLTVYASNVGYVVSDTAMQIGQTIPEGVRLQATPRDALMLAQTSLYTSNIYLKQVLSSDNTIAESYVGFIMDDAFRERFDCWGNAACTARFNNLVNGTYELRGGVDESNETTTPIYDANVNTSKTVFNYALQPGLCNTGTQQEWKCRASVAEQGFSSWISSHIVPDGEIRFDERQGSHAGQLYDCRISSSGTSACYAGDF